MKIIQANESKSLSVLISAISGSTGGAVIGGHIGGVNGALIGGAIGTLLTGFLEWRSLNK
ncbi:hypothetical protein [Dyadobacter sandarakinus]|uniref:Uncharacterized protein n=1 Tax=Dyadobacter sandarakinus TaxID=2747268 RepID=A0ABX7I1T9_9BACT|nr:hypothetical protein [Dyadobacter sandarakinus]QRR00009.1 hypothetical protein HWI92_03275 [Dyadobacter sandarakinus]